MIYELRTYWAAPGKQEQLNHRFRSLTMGIFARHQMQVIGFWVPEPANEESGDLVYILAFANQAAMQAAWNAFRDDPEWISGKAASEVEGVLTAKISSVILQPTDYSPLT